MLSTAKNTFYLLVAYTYQKLVALFYFILLARYLGVANFGRYTFALSFTTLFSVLVCFGLHAVLTREIARDRTKTKSYFGNIFSFQLLTGLGSLGLIYILINALGYPAITKNLVYLAGLIMLLDSLALTFYQVFRGHLNLKFESLGIIIHKTVMVALGVVLMKLGASLVLMMAPLLAGSLFYLGNAIFFLRKKLGLWPVFRFEKQVLKFLLKLAIPFFIALIFSKLYASIDVILLSKLGGDKFVGLYSAAQKLILAFLLLIAGSFGSAIYPSFSYWFVRSREKLSLLFHESVFYLMLITLPLVFGVAILSRPIILFIYGAEYLEATRAMIILGLAMPFMFIDYIMAGLLNACERQRTNTTIHGAGVVILIILNVILIPLWYHLGASIACLASFLVIFLLEAYFVPKLVRPDRGYLFKKIGGIFFACLIMTGFLLLASAKIHLILSVALGAVVYLVSLYLLRTIRKQDLIALKDLILEKER